MEIGATVASVGMQGCGAEAPDYGAVYGATEKSLNRLKTHTYEVMGSAAKDRELMQSAATFEQSNILQSWTDQISDINKAQTETLRQSGFAEAGTLKRDYAEAKERQGRQFEYQRGAQEMELQKAIRQSEASTMAAMQNIQSQMGALEAQFAASTGYEFKRGGPPQESVDCMGNVEKDQGYMDRPY